MTAEFQLSQPRPKTRKIAVASVMMTPQAVVARRRRSLSSGEGLFWRLYLAISAVVMVASGMEEDNFRKQYPAVPDFYSEKEKVDFRLGMLYLSSSIPP